MLAQERPDFSVVIPVYNSDRTLRSLHKQLVETFAEMGCRYELIFVNDGSVDNSWSVLNAIKRDDPSHVLIINLMQNYGQHKALMCGFQFSRAPYIITIDDDLQSPPAEIPKLIACSEKEEADLVYGVYGQKRHSRIKNIGSKGIEWLFSNYASTPGRGSSFKLIRKAVTDKILDFYAANIYVDELICWHAGNIAFVEVEHQARNEGRSGYSYFLLIRIALNLIINYTTFPLRLITMSGLFVSIIFFFVGIFFIWKKFYLGAEVGYTSLIVTIFFSTGLIMFSLGIIGEYINRIFVMQSKKPNFQIKEIH